MNVCALCGERAIATVCTAGTIAGKQFSIGRCMRCGLDRSLPVLSDEELAIYYEPRYYGRRKLLFDTLINRTRVRYLVSLLPKSATVIDVGCGSGSFLALLRQRTGVRVWGTELSSRKEANDNEIGMAVTYAPLWDAGFPEASSHAVTFWHTLEHMTDPTRTLRSAYRVLVPGGILMIEVPNMNSWQARVGGRHWFHLDVPRHTFHFTPATIRALLAKTGFTIIRIRYASFFYDVFGWAQTLLNVATRRQNVLFDIIGGRVHPRDHMRDSAVTLVLLPFAGVAALVLHVLGRFFRSTSVMTVRAQKI